MLKLIVQVLLAILVFRLLGSVVSKVRNRGQKRQEEAADRCTPRLYLTPSRLSRLTDDVEVALGIEKRNRDDPPETLREISEVLPE